jgi:hypothetical protein
MDFFNHSARFVLVVFVYRNIHRIPRKRLYTFPAFVPEPEYAFRIAAYYPVLKFAVLHINVKETAYAL